MEWLVVQAVSQCKGTSKCPWSSAETGRLYDRLVEQFGMQMFTRLRQNLHTTSGPTSPHRVKGGSLRRGAHSRPGPGTGSAAGRTGDGVSRTRTRGAHRIAEALTRGILVVPVLVNGGATPTLQLKGGHVLAGAEHDSRSSREIGWLLGVAPPLTSTGTTRIPRVRASAISMRTQSCGSSIRRRPSGRRPTQSGPITAISASAASHPLPDDISSRSRNGVLSVSR